MWKMFLDENFIRKIQRENFHCSTRFAGSETTSRVENDDFIIH